MELFDAEWYLEQNPDVKKAVRNGLWASAYDHFKTHGRAEGRAPLDPAVAQLLQQPSGTPLKVEELVVSAEGTCLLIGWVDDRVDPIIEFAMQPYGDPQIDLKQHIRRFRRPDVADTKRVRPESFDFGFWAAVQGPPATWPEASIRVRFASNRVAELQLQTTTIGPIDLRDRILGLLASPRNRASRADGVDDGLTRVLAALTRAVIKQAPAPALWRCGAQVAEPELSIIISVPRDLENARRQIALLAMACDFGRIEIVFVSRSPASLDDFFAFVESMGELYGASTVAFAIGEDLSWARAHNDAARLAEGRTLLFLGSTIFPGDRDWLGRTLVVAAGMRDSDVVGACLLNEDDSVRQCGIDFTVIDRRLRIWEARRRPVRPVWCAGIAHAVSAGAILVRRHFFVELGGFDEDYIGDCSYEAYDFCFRAWVAEGAVKVDPRLIFYDLHAPAEPGDSVSSRTMPINRALFNDRWGDVLDRLANAGEILPTAAAPASRAGPLEIANTGPLELP